MPESILNQALGFEISVHTLLAQFSSVITAGVEELLMPYHALPDDDLRKRIARGAGVE